MEGILYLVGTPIGNMGDITLRAIETLENVDIIACEDTRHSSVLLAKLGIRKPLMSYYMHKEHESGEKIVSLLREGKNVALITDAGMPCVSDPGAILVQKCRENNLKYTVVPGASAVVSAMAMTGITKRGFCFLGFLPEKNKDREALVVPYKNIDIQLVFYSSPHNINDDLDFLAEILGNRRVFVVKEITKMFETVYEGDLFDCRIENPKGEFVVIIEGKEPVLELLDLTVEEHIKTHISNGLSKKEAVKLTAKERGVPKDEIYKIAMDMDI